MADNAQQDSVKNIQIGNSINNWEGLDPVTPYLHLEAPPIEESTSTSPPNQSKYPNVVGTQRLAVTDSARNIRKRSWMGWFLWGDGTPPPGITPGYPVTEASPPQYNDENWDYFSWQYSAGYDPSDVTENNGKWKAVRLDQQPLYLNPFRINYNWPVGKFGYQKQPLTPFANNVGYWSDKKIVRGPNLSLAYPYLVEYADYVDKTKSPNYPDEWRNSWLYVHTRPLETLVMVPGIKTPTELLTPGIWNQVGNDHQPFPYPVWDESLTPADQTPFCLKVDRMGDWDADLIWEGTHVNAKNYDQNKYQPTAFNEPGKGNYLKMTVAQGSPLIWCETNNSQYVNFYNLIRTNEPNHIDNTGGTRPTNAGMAIDPVTHEAVWDVPGVNDVQYVLLYGNQTNPNQFYHEVEPFKWDEQTGLPGGWNPPGKQSNHTYIAIYFKKDAIVPVNLSQHSGTDGDGNPYFCLEFKHKDQKNWYVVGAIPVMRYYHSEVPEDDEPKRLMAARRWAEAMGLYAFNFLTDTKISFEVANMYKATTTYKTFLTNPYVAIGQANAQLMTLDANKTVIALMPHHYQPITLGADLTQPSDSNAGSTNPSEANPIVWHPLQTVGADLPIGVIDLPHANQSDPTAQSCWGYWSPRGNLKTLATDQFVTQFLFQNFLPLLPPPNWEKEYAQTSIQGVRIVDVGQGYEKLPTDEDAPPDDALPQATIVSPTGAGAVLKVILQPYTDKIQQIDVVSGGIGYPDGNPPQAVTVQIDSPRVSGGQTATARAQIGGGKVLAIFMNDHGSGYRSTIQITTTDTQDSTDAAIVLPRFADDGKNLLKGLANVVVGGAGWLSANPAATVSGTGQNAKAEVIKPGQILQINNIGIGFTDEGAYPSTGDPEVDARSIVVHVPPPTSGGMAQTMRVASVYPTRQYFKTLITDPGAGYSQLAKDSIQCVKTQDGSPIALSGILPDGDRIIAADPNLAGIPFDHPFEVTFKAAAGIAPPQREAKAVIYPGFSIAAVELTGETVSGYQTDLEIAFSGGDICPSGMVMPELMLEFRAGQLNRVSVQSAGSGFYRSGWFDVHGGKGFNAALRPVLTEGDRGTLVAVKVVRSGSNYPTEIAAYTNPGNKPLNVTIEAGQITSVDLIPNVDYSGFDTTPSIFLISKDGLDKGGDFNAYPPKGQNARIHFTVNENGAVSVANIEPGEGYLDGASFTASIDSLPITLKYGDIGQIASANQAAGFIAEVAKPTLKVEQVLYDSLISRFSTLASNDLRPFGGGFGGRSGPDGYGLGNALSAVAKVLGVLYHLQQHYASKNQDVPSVQPSLFAMQQTDNTNHKFEFPIYLQHNPLVSLKGSLKTMTQALQRTLTLFFQQVPYTNNPSSDTWKMAYFAQYDKAGRVVVNPTATIPVYGVVSSTANPPAISDAENQDKQGLDRWHPGMLWSGFGVSDQWNDQHYFYGYYLSTAALLALLDGAWSETKPDRLWADPDQMGTAIDQWMKTLAYDPALEGHYFDFNNACQTNHVTYGKYSFFDQWNGHPWATGISPGRAGDVEDGRRRGPTPWSIWSSYGTGNAPFDDENENSTWEGLQAFSSIILWGAGTDRKAIVDQGIYLLTTGNAASDLYFLDKNYNLKRGSDNPYTWCPVTTGTPASHKDGGNSYPNNTGFVDSSPEAFYGEASAGCSILQKGSPSLNNFFYAFPTGSKFIQAYPPTAWTMGMTRNLPYMQKWAQAMTRPEWKHARDSELFQPGNWLGMAMTSALCGVPYNPGDDPTQVQPYADRLWSSWNVSGQEPGSQGIMQPAEQPTSVLHLLHVMEEYGAPDWSIYAQVVDADGNSADTDIVFTAAFSKISKVDASLVVTTYVAFNPGWTPCYVNFYRLGSDGTLSNEPLRIRQERQPLEVPPKKMVVVTRIVVKTDQAPAKDAQMGSFAALSNGTLVGVDSNSATPGQLFQKELPDDPWLPTLKTPIAISQMAALPVDIIQGQVTYPKDTLIGVSNGNLYTRLNVFEPWVALPITPEKVENLTVAADGTLYATTSDGQLLKRSILEAHWQNLSAADTPMRSIAVLSDNTTMLGVGREGGNDGALFQKTTLAGSWSRNDSVRFNSLHHLAVNHQSGQLIVANKSNTNFLYQDADNRSVQKLTQLVVKAASEPQAPILANTNPNFYRTTVSETDPDLHGIYTQRRLIYYASTQSLYLGQDDLSKMMEFVPKDKHLTVCALNLTLAGDITIPQADIRIYCQNLTVQQGLPVTIDVSPAPLELEYRSGALTAPPQTGGSGSRGISGAENNADQGKKYGTSGAKGGSITIICDQLTLNDQLTLKACGGEGYPGADGQDGVDGANGSDGRIEVKCTESHGSTVSPPVTTCNSPTTVSTATQGQAGGRGGDALKGGDGGKAGEVNLSYRSCSSSSNLVTQVSGGQGGVSGNPGKGKTQGLGGKTYRVTSTFHNLTGRTTEDTEFVSQEFPKDTDTRPISPDGSPAGNVAPGDKGTSQISTLQDVSSLGDVMHDLFLLMVLQTIKFRYLNCNPQQFSVPSSPNASPVYTYFPGDETEWGNIGSLINWLTSVLANFKAKPTDGNLSHFRKFYIQSQASIYALRYKQSRTYYNNLANWVPRQSFDSIKTEFSDNVAVLIKIEKEYSLLAKSYEDTNQKTLDKGDYEAQLQTAQAYHQKAYQDAASQISGARDDVETAQTALNKAQNSLTNQLTQLEQAIGSHFQCRLDVIIQGLQMMAFAHGSPMTTAMMGTAELTDFLNEGMNDLKLADGRVEDKKYLIQQMISLGGDLNNDFATQVLNNGTLRYSDTNTARFMADLNKLDSEIDNLSQELDTAGVKTAVQDFRNVLVQRSDAILAYNAVIDTALQYLQAYNDDTNKLNALENQPSFDPYDMEMFSFYAQQYQEQVDNVLRLLYLARRKSSFLAPKLNTQISDFWKNWTALWTQDSVPDRSTSASSFTSQLVALQTNLTDQFAASNSANTPFPANEGSYGGIQLSDLVVRLSDNLVQTLKTSGSVTFTTVPGRLTVSQLQRISNPLKVSNSDNYYDIRISHVRPYLVGATTVGGQVRIRIKNNGRNSFIDDDANGLYQFTHTPASTSFIHTTLTAFPTGSAYQPPATDGGGGITDSILDSVSIYGSWTLSVSAPNPDDPLDTNHGLDLSHLSEVRIYFKGYHYSR